MAGKGVSWTPERRAAQAERMRQRNADPAYKAKLLDGAARSLRERWQTPEWRDKMSGCRVRFTDEERDNLRRMGVPKGQEQLYKALRRYNKLTVNEALEVAKNEHRLAGVAAAQGAGGDRGAERDDMGGNDDPQTLC